MYAEAYVKTTGTISGNVFISVKFLDVSGATLRDDNTILNLASASSWTLLSVTTAAARAGSVSISVTVQAMTLTGTGFWYIDSVAAYSELGAPGVVPDGKGGIQVDFGTTLADDGRERPSSRRRAWAWYCLAACISRMGSIRDCLRLLRREFPKIIINTIDFKVYRNTGSAWTKAADPADIVAGTITALVSLISPTISGGSISGTSLSIVSGSKTINIDGTNYVKVSDSSTGWVMEMTNGFIRASFGSLMVTITPNGVTVANGGNSVGVGSGGLP